MAKIKEGNLSDVIGYIKNAGDKEDLSKFGREFQLKLLALLIKDRIFSFSIFPIIKNEYFSDIYLRKIFIIIMKYINSYQSLPTIDNIKILLSENGEKTVLYDKILNSIQDVSMSDRDFVMQHARQFCFSRHALTELKKIEHLLVEGDFEKAKSTSTEAFKYSGITTTKVYDLKEDFEAVFESDTIRNPVPMPFKTFNDNTQGGPGKGNLVISIAPSNFGKCYSPNTPVMMFDCSIKMIQDIVVGDIVMGWDGKPRTVNRLDHGHTEMYKVDQNNGESYTVNKRHELCLINSWDEVNAGNIYTMNPVEYLERMNPISSNVNTKSKWNAKWRKGNRGLKSPGINFGNFNTEIDPYLLGVWLGDGFKKGPWVCGVDSEIKDYLIKQCNINEIELTETIDPRTNVMTWKISGENDFFRNFLKKNNLINNKHIPKDFLFNSYKNRLALLAGLIDTDGGLGVTKTSVEITQRLKSLSDQICFLCRSIGLRVTRKTKIIKGQEYFRLIISGKRLLDVPTILSRKKFLQLKTKKDELKTKITVTPVGMGEYFGFSIEEEDKMFLLEDFTVAHNTAALTAYARHANSLGKKVAFFSFEIGGIDIIKRYLAGLIDVKQEDVKNNKELIREKMADVNLGNLKLIEERATNARINVIRNHVEYLKSTGFFPDMICIDSLNQLKLPIGMRYEGDNQKFEYLAEELRDLANELELPIHTVFQTNRCLSYTTDIQSLIRGKVKINDIDVGEEILTHDGYKKVLDKFYSQEYCYKIKLKSGKEIICSGKHLFPVENGTLESIETGLTVNTKLLVKKYRKIRI